MQYFGNALNLNVHLSSLVFFAHVLYPPGTLVADIRADAQKQGKT